MQTPLIITFSLLFHTITALSLHLKKKKNGVDFLEVSKLCEEMMYLEIEIDQILNAVNFLTIFLDKIPLPMKIPDQWAIFLDSPHTS